jgi:hypothetical protein
MCHFRKKNETSSRQQWTNKDKQQVCKHLFVAVWRPQKRRLRLETIKNKCSCTLPPPAAVSDEYAMHSSFSETLKLPLGHTFEKAPNLDFAKEALKETDA